MWCWLCVFVLLLIFFALRYAIVKLLSAVSTRDLHTLGAVRRVLQLLCADPKQAKVVLTRDRSAYVPGASRRWSRRR